MALPETFTQFARTAAEQLRWKKARPLVEDELLTHLCDQRDALMAGGMDETVATAESLRLTGDPYEIGTELDRVHRPKTPKLLFALAALIALAGLAFTALVSFRDYELSYFAVHQSVALLLGTAAMLAAYFLDFTLLGRFALPLTLVFHAALILLGLLPIGGFWLRYIYVSTHILLRGLPLLFPLMFAVLLYALRGRRGWGVFAAFVCLAVQCIFCLRVPCLLDLGFLFLCDSALLIFCAHSGWLGLGAKRERCSPLSCSLPAQRRFSFSVQAGLRVSSPLCLILTPTLTDTAIKPLYCVNCCKMPNLSVRAAWDRTAHSTLPAGRASAWSTYRRTR